MRMSFGILIAAFIGLAAFVIRADGFYQKPLSIEGSIHDEAGMALKNVDVFAIDRGGNDKHALSDGNGKYDVVIPARDEIKVVLFDNGNANAKKLIVAVQIDGRLRHDVSWVLRPMQALDEETQTYFRAVLKRLVESKATSEAFKNKARQFL